MSEPFIGEIRLFAFPRIPTGWLPCNGQSLQIQAFDALFAVIGTTYGGDGQMTFNAPDLRGRVPIGQGQAPGVPPYELGQLGGEDTHTLIEREMPSHSHALTSSTATADTAAPGATMHLATASVGNLYAPMASAAPYEVMAACVNASGGGLPHNNIMPTLVGNYCIAYNGIFPSQS